MTGVRETKGRFRGPPPNPEAAVQVSGTEPVTRRRADFALDLLRRRGVLGAAPSRKLGARVDPGLIEAARARLGGGSDTQLITAALAVLAGGDDFGPWLAAQAGRLPADFELDF